jgi:hypothetical protein
MVYLLLTKICDIGTPLREKHRVEPLESEDVLMEYNFATKPLEKNTSGRRAPDVSLKAEEAGQVVTRGP